ncbi:MAG: 3'-5' exonuclease [Pyrinomonadaceae bacterium]|nr:3'-5' exonuclease [Pyrinomonadaceae bacterium]
MRKSKASQIVPRLMYFNTKQLYTPALAIYEFNERSLIVDTETVGAGGTTEIIEIAFGDAKGEIVFQSLVRPVFNTRTRLPKESRFEREELEAAPYWTDIWPQVRELVRNRLLIAYNAGFDRRALAASCSRHNHQTEERGWRCAMQLVKQVAGVKKSLPLAEACALYGLPGGTHRAAADVRATYNLLNALKNSIRD